jgi:hypothetical protein
VAWPAVLWLSFTVRTSKQKEATNFMQCRFISLVIPHCHGDLQPGEVDHVMPVARGEIQLEQTDELRRFCLVGGEMPDGDPLVGMSWPHPDPAVRANEILPYAQLARAWTHAPLVATRADGAIHLWADLIQELIDIVEPTSEQEAQAFSKAFVEAFQRRLGLCFLDPDAHRHPHAG